MDEREKPASGQYKSIIFDKKSWDLIKEEVLRMARDNFGLQDENKKVLGVVVDGKDWESYVSLQDAFCSDDTTVILLQDPTQKGKVIGYSLAMPINRMNPIRTDGKETAYIYQTVVEDPYRGKGLVGLLTDPLFEELAKKGYRFVERDSRVRNGYADTVSKHYAGAFVEEPYDHDPFGIGVERHFRIDIQKYLAQGDISKEK